MIETTSFEMFEKPPISLHELYKNIHGEGGGGGSGSFLYIFILLFGDSYSIIVSLSIYKCI